MIHQALQFLQGGGRKVMIHQALQFLQGGGGGGRKVMIHQALQFLQGGRKVMIYNNNGQIISKKITIY